MTHICLIGCGIGLSGSTSLAELLRSQETNLTELDLSRNPINDNCAVILTDSLSNVLDLDKNSGITARGASSILKCVCNTSSINGAIGPNHSLSSFGLGLYLSTELLEATSRALLTMMPFFFLCRRRRMSRPKKRFL
mmetsp:Transcript_23799/g.42828  ORF Transcript_23799/g.42828 Transcript_23799/m.42828 type:complete len:137 (-) Transcript_23799:1711-2121(-)